MKKTHAGLSLIIPARGDEWMLRETVKNAVRTAGLGVPLEVIVIDAGVPEGLLPERDVRVIRAPGAGTSATRHLGMMHASHEICVTIDAHVMLHADWGVKIVDCFTRRKGYRRAVTCGSVGSIKFDREKRKILSWGDDGKFYTGARLHWADGSAERRYLIGKWDGPHEGGTEIGCVMGAFYALTRSWYIEMGRPWACNASWGCDEETISLASYCSGGSVRLLPNDIRASHAFNMAAVKYTPEELAVIRATRANLLRLFPFTEAERDTLTTFSPRYPIPSAPLTVDQEAFRQKMEGTRARLEEYLRTMVAGYHVLEKGAPIARTAEVDEAAKAAREEFERRRLEETLERRSRESAQCLKPRVTPVDVCDRCDARNSFRVTHSRGGIQYLRCAKCGRRAWRRLSTGDISFEIRND